MKHKLPNKISVCSSCPFRKDAMKGWLGKERIIEILNMASFVCHKTVEEGKTRLQCAGHMLIKGEQNEFVQLANRLNMPLRLSGGNLVFATEKDCISHHSINTSEYLKS